MENTAPPDIFRSIGFDTVYMPGKHHETIFFIGPNGEQMENVSPEAVEEYINYCEKQLKVAKDYVDNNYNNKTHEWTYDLF